MAKIGLDDIKTKYGENSLEYRVSQDIVKTLNKTGNQLDPSKDIDAFFNSAKARTDLTFLSQATVDALLAKLPASGSVAVSSLTGWRKALATLADKHAIGKGDGKTSSTEVLAFLKSTEVGEYKTTPGKFEAPISANLTGPYVIATDRLNLLKQELLAMGTPTPASLRATVVATTAATPVTPTTTATPEPGDTIYRGVINSQTDKGAFNGSVLVSSKGIIKAVLPMDFKVPAGVSGVKDVGGPDFEINPGFMGMHDHPTYDPLLPLATTKDYDNRNQWPNAPGYDTYVNNPDKVYTDDNLSGATEAESEYVEDMKALGGTTTMQGEPSNAATAHTGVRGAELSNPDIGADLVGANVIGFKGANAAAWATANTAIEKLDAYYLHVEGTDAETATEMDALLTHLTPKAMSKVVIIHGNGITDAQFAKWAQICAAQGTVPRLVWSPTSNGMLYNLKNGVKGTFTTPIISAIRKYHAIVALGPDWGPTGNKSVFWEAKTVKQLSEGGYLEGGQKLTDAEIVTMMTRNGALVQGGPWAQKLGQIAPGMVADMTIVRTGANADPNTNVLDCMEHDIRLTVVGGQATAGDADLMDKLVDPSKTQSTSLAGHPKKVLGTHSIASLQATLLKSLSYDPVYFAQRLNAGNPHQKPNPFAARLAIVTWLNAQYAKDRAAKKPNVPADIDVKADITAVQVTDYLDRKDPNRKPITQISGLFQEDDKAFHDGLYANLNFKPGPNQHLDLSPLERFYKLSTNLAAAH